MATSPTKTTTALVTPLKDQLDRLAAFEACGAPVVSLYLDMRSNQHGRDNSSTFLRKASTEHIQAYHGEGRQDLENAFARIERYLEGDVRRSANGLAVFACAKTDLFEAIQLDAPLDEHAISIGPVPQLYTLARLNDQYPRYAALLVNTNSARLFVFSLGSTEARHQVTNEKTRKTMMGGWSQARYQRHNENFHLHHIKEVVELLDRVVTSEAIGQIVLSCEEVAKPMLMEQLPKHLADKVIDMVNLSVTSPEHEVLKATMGTLREHDADTDVEHVEALLGEWRSGGLGVTGAAKTRRALEMGQVEELLITTQPQQLDNPAKANDFVAKAQQTSARIRFIEDPQLLADVGGVGALLRFRI